uniref:Uncharacterized protein n=1 Tax=Arundo donax TaxID=35708 RepID=A0A0A9GIY8_ARUDO
MSRSKLLVPETHHDLAALDEVHPLVNCSCDIFQVLVL